MKGDQNEYKIHLPLFGATYMYAQSKRLMGVQWLSGRVLVSRSRGCGFEPHRRHCVVSLNKTHKCLVLVQPRKTCPDITEKLLTWT